MKSSSVPVHPLKYDDESWLPRNRSLTGRHQNLKNENGEEDDKSRLLISTSNQMNENDRILGSSEVGEEGDEYHIQHQQFISSHQIQNEEENQTKKGVRLLSHLTMFKISLGLAPIWYI